MIQFFLLTFVVIASLLIGAMSSLGTAVDKGVVHLIWQTDPNPARSYQVDVFNKQHANIKVTIDPGVPEKLIVQCATGTGPDLIDGIRLMNLGSLVQAGILLDLSKAEGHEYFLPEKTYPSVRPGLMYNGSQYRFPCNVTANCVLYNKEVFDDAGVPYPKPDWTYADFIKAGAKINKGPWKSGQKRVAVGNMGSFFYLLDLFTSHGAEFFSADGLRCTLDSPKAVAAFEFYRELIYKHKVLPSATETQALSSAGGWGTGGLNLFSSGKAGMLFVGRWFLVVAPNYPGITGKLGVAMLPRIGKEPSSGFIDVRGTGVNSQSKHIPEALEFMRYLASDEYSKIIIKDGDSLPPNMAMAKSGNDLVNEYMPDPAFHGAFLKAADQAKSFRLSQFADFNLVCRWLQSECIEKVEGSEAASPKAVLKELAEEVNAHIRQNIERSSDLQLKYEAITGKAYKSDWWVKK